MDDICLYINTIELKDNIEESKYNEFPLNIAALRAFKSLRFTSPVTIFNGKNGCGKSTIIEGIADFMGLPVCGGNSWMSAFVNTNQLIGKEEAPLSKYLRIGRSGMKPKQSYFFRAESFHELSSMIDDDSRKGGLDGYLSTSNFSSNDLLGQSHGQSFMDLMLHQMSYKGLYILDEPESALSPENQLKLLCLIDSLSKEGSQFIIATHSPIIMGYRNARIINFDDGMKEITFKETNVYRLYSRFINDNERFQSMLFDED